MGLALSLYNIMCGIPNTVLEMSYNMLSQDNKRRTITLLLIIIITTQIPIAQAGITSIIRTEIEIDLGEGIKTDAQITTPSVGDGPFPVVLLVPGGGLTDMDEYIPAGATETGEPAAPMKQIAEYLSERGYMVLRYNKRGTTRNATMADYAVYSKATVETFKADAEKALQVLKNEARADTSDITVIGHSESSIIVTRMAKDDPSINKIVMLGGAARDYLDIKYTQIVELRIEFVETVLDMDHDGLVSLEEAIEGMEPYTSAILPKNSLLMGTGNETQWIPTWDPDSDGYMNITGEFIPVLERLHSILSNPNYPGYNQTQAHVTWGATMDMISELNSSILILQGEGDFQTPLIEAILLEQALIDGDHRDHTLYTYPGLSHFFYPTDGWQSAMGPIEPYVLRDLYEWLVSPIRTMDQVAEDNQTNAEAIQSLETEIDSVNQSLTDSISEIENTLEQEGGNDYMIPVMTVILVLIIVTTKKRRENQ
jgi:uncharacterized protein